MTSGVVRALREIRRPSSSSNSNRIIQSTDNPANIQQSSRCSLVRAAFPRKQVPHSLICSFCFSAKSCLNSAGCFGARTNEQRSTTDERMSWNSPYMFPFWGEVGTSTSARAVHSGKAGEFSQALVTRASTRAVAGNPDDAARHKGITF